MERKENTRGIAINVMMLHSPSPIQSYSQSCTVTSKSHDRSNQDQTKLALDPSGKEGRKKKTLDRDTT